MRVAVVAASRSRSPRVEASSTIRIVRVFEDVGVAASLRAASPFTVAPMTR